MIRKVGKRYQALVYLSPGKRRSAGTYSTLAEAKRAHRRIEAEAHLTRASGVAGGMSVEACAQWWLEKMHGAGTRRPTLAAKMNNEDAISLFRRDFGSQRIDRITHDDAKDWARTDHNAWRVKALKAMFTDAVREQHLLSNPFAHIVAAKGKGRSNIAPLTADEIEKLCQIALGERDLYGPTMAAWISFCAWVGTRPGELFALRVSDLDMNAGLVRISEQRPSRGKTEEDGKPRLPKGQRIREVICPPQVIAAIQAAPRQVGPLLFPSMTGKQISQPLSRLYWVPVRDAFQAQLSPARRFELLDGCPGRRKPDLDLYDLRHFCGSMLADRGLDAITISEQLGNSPKVCEDIYVHAYRDRALDRLRGAYGIEPMGDKMGDGKAAIPLVA